MDNLQKKILAVINLIGQAIPKRLQRRITDSPGALKIFQKISSKALVEISTPEQNILVVNPLFHSHFNNSDSLRDYEPDIRQAIIKFTKPGMVAYDIGANVGVFSFLFSSIVGNDGIVYSFEPEENNYSCFELSLKKTTRKNIVLDRRAVGRTRSTEKFDRRGGAFSGRLIGNGSYDVTENIKTVETVSIDFVVEKEGYRVPDILKIDVEGNEDMVLEGMKDILLSYRPVVICELHTHLGESSEQVTNLLSSYGYKIFDIEEVLTKNNPGELTLNAPTGKHIIAIK